MIDRAAVMAALSTVRDPELDEAITGLGFVGAVEVDGSRVGVRLRLPTYFCAPNFAYMMVADARNAVRAVPGVSQALVSLDDHFASDEINSGVGDGQSFQDTFTDLADDELGELRSLFNRKAFLVRQEKLCRLLLARGLQAEDLATVKLGDLPPSPETDVYLERRAELGLDPAPEAPFLVGAGGDAVGAAKVSDHLRFASTIRVSVEGNAGMCRGLLATRYGLPDPEEATL